MPEAWTGFSFKVNFRGSVLMVSVTSEGTQINRESGPELDLWLSGQTLRV